MSNVSDMHTTRPEGMGDEWNFYDTQKLRALSDDEAQTELLILSRDPELIHMVRTAAPRIAHVIDAHDLDRASEIPNLQPGVIVIDMSIAPDLAVMLPQLPQHFPEVVIIVAGRREDVSELMQLTAGGRIFRFLLVPLGHGQTRLALGAAVAQHLQVKAQNLRTGEFQVAAPFANKYRIAYMALGLGVLVVIGGIWFAVRAFMEPPPVPADRVAQQPVLSPSKLDPVQAELALAKEAFAQGKYVAPSGESALELYRNVIALDPANNDAQAGIRAIVDKTLEGVQQALTAERLDDAVRGIETARAIDATHPRLAFLDAQVAREKERLKLDRARDTTNRVRELVEQATADIKQQRLLLPPGANAREALEQAYLLDPQDPGVALATRELGAAMMDAAIRTLNAGDFVQAQKLVDAVRTLGATGAGFAEIERAVADAARRAASSPATEARQDAVSDARPSAGVSTKQPQRDVRQQLDSTEATVNRAPEVVADVRTPSQTVVTLTAGQSVSIPTAPQQQRPSDEILQAADLVRTREVAPDYPPQAVLDGTEGWVQIDFTISPEGVPQDLNVRDAKPRRVFDRPALASVRQWRFQPIVENGVPVAKRATLRVRFQRQ